MHQKITQTAPKTVTKQHRNCTENSPNCIENIHETTTKQLSKRHKKCPRRRYRRRYATISPSPPPPNPLSSDAGVMVSLHSLSHAKNALNANWVLVSGLLLAPHELGPTPTNSLDSKTTLNIFSFFKKI